MAYFNKSRFPTVAEFAKLERSDQDLVVRACKQGGVAMAVECIFWLTPEEENDEET